MRQNIFPKVALVAGIIIFASVFLFARALISIAFYTIIILFFINSDFYFDKSRFQRYIPLLFLLAAGVIINGAYLYGYIVYGQTITFNQLVAYANPIIIVIYTYSLCYFLSQNKNLGDYLLWAYLVVTVLLSLLCFIKFLYNSNINLIDVYGSYGSGTDVQGVIAFTFPFVSVCILNLALRASKIKNRIFFLLCALLVIFTDLFINTSKIGYIVEIFVLVYYAFAFIKLYSFKDGYFKIKKMLIMILLSLLALTFIFCFAYQKSPIFHTKTAEFVKSFEILYQSKKDSDKTAKSLFEQPSTGIRMIYYISSVEIFKEYPSVFLWGCSFTGNTSDLNKCTQYLIKNSQQLQANPMVIKNHPLEPHNEFINYAFKGGVFSAFCLLMFFISLFYSTKNFPFQDRFGLRVLILGYFVASLTGYYLSTQYEVSIFFTLIAIFLSKFEKRQ
ncbi:O-antigen ligase family protein [Francisella tularensis]|uniref:O-antigen ligase family protein n=1 Tax=Francisella tularensis TaxID=263 RepID=UPI00018553F0|nr:O-antigen ligase family protein [Francisella tularensis]EDZ90661.1 O-Antigen Polymerase family protein [Francisella tularensis subsp. novicida FTG]MBK2335386.1 O-antigen ligase family protein [Francisella tularensis subsp. novicida]